MIRIRLAEVLRNKKKTPYWLAKHSGLVKATIYKLVKSDRGGMDFSTLNAICRTLDCQPGELLVYEKDEEVFGVPDKFIK